jgi:hypothetical protein
MSASAFMPVYTPAQINAQRGLLALAGALVLDGTASNAVTAINNAALATGLDGFSHYYVGKRATYVPAAEISLVEKAASNLGWRFRLTTGGFLRLQIGNGTNYTTFSYTSTVPISTGANRPAHLAFSATRAGSVIFYQDGVQLGAAVTISGSVAQTVTNTGTLRAGFDGTTSDTCLIRSHTHYNLALTQADITEIHELNGDVPERFRFGSQVQLLPNTGFVSDPTVAANGRWVLDAGVTWNSGAARIDFSGASIFLRGSDTAGDAWSPVGYNPRRTTWRIAYTVSNFASGAVRLANESGVALAQSNGTTVPDAVANGAYSYIVNSALVARFMFGAIGASAFSLDDVSITRLGAVAHFDGDDLNASYQWPDRSTNALHSLRTATGTAPTKQILGPFPVRLTSDGTITAQQLGGGTLFPANVQFTRILARARTGTPSITLGTASGGSQLVASVALTTAWQNLTIALAGGVLTTASSVWLTASAANVVEVQISAEQLTA